MSRASHIDQSNCHPLDYFLADPRRFDYGSELAGKKPGEIQDKVQSLRIGETGGYTVTQVTHTIDGNELTIKMLLVTRKPGEFCEIYHQQDMPDVVEVQPAYFVEVGSESILGTSDRTNGNGNWFEEAYWSFDKDGPIDLDVLDKINEIQGELLPDGMIVHNGGGFDPQKLTYSMAVWRKDDPHCCPTGGRIEIKFGLKGHGLIVITQNFYAK